MIQCITGLVGVGLPVVAWNPFANSQAIITGDVEGLTTAGLLERLGSAAITSGGGIWGFAANSDTTDANGNIISPTIPSTINPGVPAVFAIPSYGRRVTPAAPIAGVQRGQGQSYLACPQNFFIQRHKAGTRVNDSLIGKLCNLTWNGSAGTNGEWEVDTTATNVSDIVVAPWQLPNYQDNGNSVLGPGLWDSATFATDSLGAWVVFQVAPAWQASNLGLRY